MDKGTDRIQQLTIAVAEEKRATDEFFREARHLSKGEQRKRGLLLFPLKIAELQAGSRTSISFQTSFSINDTYFRKGCSVTLKAGNQQVNGKLIELNEYSVTIVLTEESDADFYEQPELLYREDDRTLQCMELGLRFAEEKEHLRRIRNDIETPISRIAVPRTAENPEPSGRSLNPLQTLAVRYICSDKPIVLIQGPPGTGKTRVLTEAIRLLSLAGKKIVISAPSNTAVDHLSLQLVQNHISLLRLGNEEKIDERLLAFTIDGHLQASSHRTQLKHLSKQLQKAAESADRHIRNYTREAADEKRAAQKEARTLRKEIRQLEDSFRNSLLEKVSVVAGTPVGLFNQLPSGFMADAVVIDEAGQAPEPLSWLAAVFGNRLVLAGDPQQLPPTVFSQKAARLGLSESLLEWAADAGNYILLNEQYRMSEAVKNAINEPFYRGELQTARDYSAGKLVFIDMAGYGENETKDSESGSISNIQEVSVIQLFLQQEQYASENTVILSPYNAQIGELKRKLPSWKISTIDSIQGQESDNIVISLVRSNDEGEIGFLSDYRRMNVAISRAREHCIVVGDSATIGSDKFYGGLLAHIEANGGYKSAWEFGV